MIKNWGKGRDRSWFMGDEIGHESWATRSVMGNDKIERATRLVISNDERVTRLVMGNDGADEIGFGWIGHPWWCDLGGVRLVWGEISVVVRSRWRRRCWGAIGFGWIGNSLSFSLHVWDLEMVCSENRNVNQFPGQSLKHTVNWNVFPKNFIFHAQPNTQWSVKSFPEMVLHQNKRSLSSWPF